jgi:hypothetical protein
VAAAVGVGRKSLDDVFEPESGLDRHGRHRRAPGSEGAGFRGSVVLGFRVRVPGSGFRVPMFCPWHLAPGTRHLAPGTSAPGTSAPGTQHRSR